MSSDLLRISLKACLVAAAVAAFCAGGPARGATPDAEARLAARRTFVVKLVEECLPSAAAAQSVAGNVTTTESGVIIHEAGYVLTSNTVGGGANGRVQMSDGTVLPSTTLLQIPEFNLALVKVDAGRPLKPMRIGRSAEAKLGEPVVIIANQAGLTNTVSTGIVSRFDGDIIQTTAATNSGSFGAPLIDSRGRLIGILYANRADKENIAFAIGTDALCRKFPEILSAEKRYGIRLGLAVEPMGEPKVTAVEEGSPAADAGIEVGDIIREAGTLRIDHPLHVHIALINRKPGEELPLKVQRGEATLTFNLTVGELPFRPAEDVAGLVKGAINWSVYFGNWQALPNFDEFGPAENGQAPAISQTAYPKVDRSFGLRFTGYVEVPADGLYTFYTASDDGSRLWIGDELLVDNDGVHGVVEKSESIRLKAGKHPIKVTYFQAGYGFSLQVLYKGPTFDKRVIPADALYAVPEAKTK